MAFGIVTLLGRHCKNNPKRSWNLHQVLLIGATALGAWLGMQAVHEMGHVLGAWITGGRVERVVLHPLTISRTDLSHNPHPLAVVWAGPVFGVAAPLVFWGLAAAARFVAAFVFRWFAGFCLLANGLYVAGGSFDGIGDSGEMLRHGAPIWTLWLFGAAAAPVGLWLWHNQGPHFGLGAARGLVHRGVAYGAGVAFLVLLALGLIVGRD